MDAIEPKLTRELMTRRSTGPVLPAIIAGLTSFLAILANPRALGKTLVRRPLASLGILATLALLGFGKQLSFDPLSEFLRLAGLLIGIQKDERGFP